MLSFAIIGGSGALLCEHLPRQYSLRDEYFLRHGRRYHLYGVRAYSVKNAARVRFVFFAK